MGFHTRFICMLHINYSWKKMNEWINTTWGYTCIHGDTFKHFTANSLNTFLNAMMQLMYAKLFTCNSQKVCFQLNAWLAWVLVWVTSNPMIKRDDTDRAQRSQMWPRDTTRWCRRNSHFNLSPRRNYWSISDCPDTWSLGLPHNLWSRSW